MRQNVVLIVSADVRRRLERESIVRKMGHWPLTAGTLGQALSYAHKLRPGLVVVDAQVGHERGLRLLEGLRATPRLKGVRLVMDGPLNTGEYDALIRDPAARAWPGGSDEAALPLLLDDVLEPQWPVGQAEKRRSA